MPTAPTSPIVQTAGTFISTLSLASSSGNPSGYFKLNIDETGVGHYSWMFDLSHLPTGTLTSQDITAISSFGLKCMC
jgi:hypothetical protein